VTVIVQATHQQVTDALAQWAATEEDWPRRTVTAMWAVVRQLGYDDTANLHMPGKFQRQVKRGLEALADSGQLVKVGRGSRTPDGRAVAQPLWYSPQTHQAATDAARVQQRADAAEGERWQAINDALAQLGIPSSQAATAAPCLSQDQWGTLMMLAKTGKELWASQPEQIAE